MNDAINHLKSPEAPIRYAVHHFQKFAREESFGGIVLLVSTIVALIWANIDFHSYEDFWETHFIVGVSDFLFDESIHFWINDALMAIFFFVVGLEIKRAVLVGDLASPRQAALPVVAAIGGMVVPALLFLAFNAGEESARGWGVPMATDIAFSLGVMALLGSRVPLSLKVFLTAFAIVDDIGAVAVIAIFYTDSISWAHLAVGGGLMGVLFIANVAGVRSPLVFGLLGAVVWIAFLKSGIHATVAGVAVAVMIPLKVKIDTYQFVDKGRGLLDEFEEGEGGPKVILTGEQREALEALEKSSKDVESPLQRLEHTLHPLVAFAIMPLFALSNAGVVIDSRLVDIIMQPVAAGIIAGLVIGKPLGILLFSYIALRTKIVLMPEGSNWRQLTGVALLGGIGFTMSIFIAGLAFIDEQFIAEAKIGILIASIIAGAVGYLLLLTGGGEGSKPTKL